VLKVIVIVRETPLLVVFGRGLGWSRDQIFLLRWVGLGCISQLLSLVRLGQTKCTYGQLYATCLVKPRLHDTTCCMV